MASPLVGATGCAGRQPVDVAMYDGDLYVAYNGDDGDITKAGIGVYDSATGAFIDFLTDPKLNDPEGVAIDSNGYMYVSQGLFGQEGYMDVVFVTGNPIPDPASSVLLLLGGIGLLLRRRRRKGRSHCFGGGGVWAERGRAVSARWLPAKTR